MRLSQSLFPALAGRGRGGRKKGHGDDVEEESHVHNRMALLCKYGRQRHAEGWPLNHHLQHLAMQGHGGDSVGSPVSSRVSGNQEVGGA